MPLPTPPRHTVTLRGVAQVRVYEVARELGWESQAVRQKLQEIGHPVRSASALLPPEVVDRLRAAVAEADPPWQQLPRRGFHRLGFGGRDHYYEEHPLAGRSRLTTAEAARLCKVRPATIRQWVARGYLVAVGREGRSAVYATADVRRAQADVLARSTPTPSIDTELPLRSADLESLVNDAEAAELVDVAPSTIRMWVHRGHLKPAPDAEGPRKFTVQAVLVAARRDRAPHHGPRRRPRPGSPPAADVPSRTAGTQPD